MKWVFATNQGSLEKSNNEYPRLIRAAVSSAIENTTLQPFMVYDGAETAFTREMQDRGVTIVQHRLSFYEFIRNYQEQNHPGNWRYLQTATSAYLRVDLPLLFKRDDFLLYTDCDIIFLRDPQLDMFRPEYFSCAPERVRGDRVHFNSGVMVMNLKTLAKTHATFCEYIKQNYAKLVSFDQGAYRTHYDNMQDLLPDELNWKPYWGLNSNAQIIHFHGPKPSLALEFFTKPRVASPPLIRELFDENPQSYKVFLQKWSECHAKALFPQPPFASRHALGPNQQSNTTSFLPQVAEPARLAAAYTDLADCPEFVGSVFELNQRLKESGENIEGNVCYLDQATPTTLDHTLPTTDLDHVKKRINLGIVARESTMMLEIGLNGGHSALLCLLANPNLALVAVDIYQHKYVEKAVEYLQARFPRRFHCLRGDSRHVLPRMALERPKLRFDAIHVDGGLSEPVALTDVSNSLRLARSGALLVLDDMQAPWLARLVRQCLLLGHFRPTLAGEFIATTLQEVVRVT
jgi:predicted O-methyltransferase YrrM